MPAAVPALDDTVLPVALEHFRSDARGSRMREGAEVAHASVNMQLAVRRDAHETIKAVEARRMIRLAHTDSDDARAVSLTAALLFLVPVEAGSAFRERVLQVAARHGLALLAHLRIQSGCVATADLQPVDTEVARGA